MKGLLLLGMTFMAGAVALGGAAPISGGMVVLILILAVVL